MSYFAMGGYFPIKKDGMKTYEFRLIKPTPEGAPYITRNCKENLFNISQHHSHLYELTVEEHSILAQLVKPSYEAHNAGILPSLLQSYKFELPIEERDRALAVIISEKFWEV